MHYLKTVVIAATMLFCVPASAAVSVEKKEVSSFSHAKQWLFKKNDQAKKLIYQYRKPLIAAGAVVAAGIGYKMMRASSSKPSRPPVLPSNSGSSATSSATSASPTKPISPSSSTAQTAGAATARTHNFRTPVRGKPPVPVQPTPNRNSTMPANLNMCILSESESHKITATSPKGGRTYGCFGTKDNNGVTTFAMALNAQCHQNGDFGHYASEGYRCNPDGTWL